MCSIIYFYEHEPIDIYYMISVQSTIGLELAGGIFFKLVPLPLQHGPINFSALSYFVAQHGFKLIFYLPCSGPWIKSSTRDP